MELISGKVSDVILSLVCFNLVLLCTLSVHSQDTTGFFHCSEEFCTEVRRLNPCPETRNCSTTGFRTFLDPSECNCCNYCFDYLVEDDTCSPSSPQKPVEMCGPFLTCHETDNPSEPSTCKTIEENPNNPSDLTFCMKIRKDWMDAKDKGTLGIVQFLPECDAGGHYAPRQCIDGSLCYCSTAEGEKIFGQSLPDVQQDCACARDVARLESYGFKGKVPHCLPNGDYDELQCVGRNCYCRSFPAVYQDIVNMTKLPCFDRTIHVYNPSDSTYYMKECELRRAEFEIEIGVAELEGSLLMISDLPNCAPDGRYAPIQTNFDKKFCAEPEFGDQLENFSVAKISPEAEVMNCHCARARYLLRESATGKPQCCKNGNFRPWQRLGSRWYCVDQYGRQNVSQTPLEVYETELHQLPCYVPNDPLCSLP